jgi:hypothetical protein
MTLLDWIAGVLIAVTGGLIVEILKAWLRREQTP